MQQDISEPVFNGDLVYKFKRIVQQDISEPIFYGDLVYKFKRIVRKPSFPGQIKYFINRYRRMGYYNKSLCLVINPITADSYGLQALD